MGLFLVFIGTKIGLFFKITLPAKHQALPGLATKVQARFPYALSHQNGHTAKKSESCLGEKTKPFFNNLCTYFVTPASLFLTTRSPFFQHSHVRFEKVP